MLEAKREEIQLRLREHEETLRQEKDRIYEQQQQITSES